MSSGSDEAYMLSYIVLTGIFVKPIFILWCISLCLGRRRGDPARIGFTYMKVLFPLVAIALTLLAVSEALNYVELFVGSYSYRRSSEELYMATIRTAVTGTFFERLGGVALLITQVEIGIGFLYVLTHTREKLQTFVRFGAFAMAFLLAVLSIASIGKTLASWNIYFGYRYGSNDSESTYDSFIASLDVSARLSGAVEILFWLTNLPVLAFAAFVMHKVKSYPMLRSSGVLLLLTTILNFIRYTWNLAYAATWVLPEDPDYVPRAVTIVQPMLDVWPLFILLVLLFVISIRKQKGLWSIHQPWMISQPTFAPAMQPQGAFVPAQGGMYAAPPPGYQGQPMQYQQYPQQQMAYGVPPQPQMQQHMQPQMYPQQQQQPIPREVSPLQPSESTEPSSHELPHDTK